MLVELHVNLLDSSYIQRVAGEVVEEITEIPTTPPPRIQERTVCEPAGPPQVVKRVIRVPPRGGGYAGPQQAGSFAANASQSSNLLSAGSYGSVQQATGSFQQSGGQPAAVGGGAVYGTGVSSGFSGASGYGAPAANYGTANHGSGSFGGGYQQQASGYGGGYQQQAASYGGGYQQQASGYGGGYQQQAFAFQTQGVAPRAGLHQATCFYV